MVNLPFDRLLEETPSNYCGVDLFGPLFICSKQKELKSNGVMFACLCSHAVHKVNAYSLDTKTFPLMLKNLIGRRDNIRQIGSIPQMKIPLA